MELFSKDCINKSVAILGDVCLDLYYFTSDKNIEISVETQLPTYPVEKSKFELGGASNVAVNCKRIGIENVDVYGIVGQDYYGKIVRDLFKKENIGTEGLLTQNEDFSTNVYHKIYKDGKELPRFDFGNFNLANQKVQDRILEKLEKKLDFYELIIINEQVLSGIHNDYFAKQLNKLIERHQEKKWIADCRTKNDIYKKTIHKLNNIEGLNLVKILTNNFSSIKAKIDDEFIASYLFSYWKLPVVMTRGANGVLVVNDCGFQKINGIHIIQQLDTVGAGDSFLSGLAYGICSNYCLTDSAKIGNYAAGVSCKILFETGHPTLKDIQELASQADFRYNPVLAEDIRLANYYKNTEIEIINEDVIDSFSSFPKICIFDHDGTISVLRQGWEDIMIKTMIEIISGDKLQTLTKEELKKITKQSQDLIDKTTGVQTIIQMKELVKLVELSKYVERENILDPFSYKKIYNDKLLEKVAIRRKKLANGELEIEDVTIKDSVKTLKRFVEVGSKVYLASGTDVTDVIEEAEALGYAKFFTGGINGSEGNITLDPKRKVIKNIIKEIEDSKDIKVGECVVFGDGPVEMREAKKHGLIAIGIISDETRRWGKNLSKRERLILGGADILIPDFSCFSQISKILGWK
ncbi:MAG: HAD family hydrolase [Peptostreptococcaceae bacterium]|nr:HAD family hydrolase [Peptostreptococcaceae bacterium]